MGNGKILLLVMFGVILSACNMGALEGKQEKKFDELLQSFELTAAEIDIAKRTIAGYKNELGTRVLASRDLHQAICYATSVSMPDRFEKAHHLYLEGYAEADLDYFKWFETHGVSREIAKDMGNIYVTAHDRCKTTRGRIENLKVLKARR